MVSDGPNFASEDVTGNSQRKRSIMHEGHRSFRRASNNTLVKRLEAKVYRGPPQCGWSGGTSEFVPKVAKIQPPSYPAAKDLAQFGQGGKPGGPAIMW